jgi:hypothetical protein
VLRLNEIQHDNVGVELVVSEDFRDLIQRQEFSFEGMENGHAVYTIDASVNRPGTFQYGIRVFPKHELLPHARILECCNGFKLNSFNIQNPASKAGFFFAILLGAALIWLSLAAINSLFNATIPGKKTSCFLQVVILYAP